YLGLSVASLDPRVKAAVDFFGGLPDQFATAFSHLPPTLILHGDADTIVPVSEARKLEGVLRANAVAYEVRIYPGETHFFSPLAALDAAQRSVRFLKRHLAPGASDRRASKA